MTPYQKLILADLYANGPRRDMDLRFEHCDQRDRARGNFNYEGRGGYESMLKSLIKQKLIVPLPFNLEEQYWALTVKGIETLLEQNYLQNDVEALSR